jgi:pantothenate kinase
MLDVPHAQLVERLTARWHGYGLTPAEVAAKLQGNDLVNADLVMTRSRPADFRLRNAAAGLRNPDRPSGDAAKL